MVREPAALTPGQQLLYGTGQYGEGLMNESFAIFVLFYYREVLGLSGSLTGLALLLSLLLDAISDPLVGTLSDRTQSALGRRHPYMYLALLPALLAYYLVFAPPAGLSQLQLFAWLTLSAVAARFSMTLYNVPHMALGVELSGDYRERTRIVATRMIFSRLGAAAPGVLGLLVFMRPTERYPDGQLNPDAYPPFALVTGLLMFGAMVVGVVGTHGHIARLPRRTTQGGSLFGELLRGGTQILRLPSFRVHFFGSTVAFVGWGVMGTLGLHLATFFWRVSMGELFLWGVGMFAGIFVGIVYWARVAEFADKKRVFLLGLGIYILFTAPPVFLKVVGLWPANEHWSYLPAYIVLLGFCAHFGIASTMSTGGSMMADITDEDELVHGQRREGIFFGAVSFAAKASVGLGAQIAGAVVDLAGLVPGSDPATVPESVSRQLGAVLAVTVIGLIGLSMWIFSRYQLSAERHAEIRKALGARAGAAQGAGV
jgi:GPH family glycoside/pentoside/hexuronide:cation symporter